MDKPKRYISEVNENGESIIKKECEVPWIEVSTDKHTSQLGMVYSTHGFPVNLNKDEDFKSYQNECNSSTNLTAEDGVTVRMFDIPPGFTTPLHRTQTIDYGVVVSGKVEIVMDSGETRELGPGDVFVQRGTKHAWRNLSQVDIARMFYVLCAAQPIKLENGEVKSDLGGIKGLGDSE